MATRRRTLPIASTGIVALDRILGGGLPSPAMVVVAGEPGSGKTVLTLQMLFHAARQGQKCVYFTTLSEPAAKIINHMQAFDFFDADLVDQHITFVDLGRDIRQGAADVFRTIEERIEACSPALIAIDSFRALVEGLGGRNEIRQFIYDLSCQTASWGVTALLVGEYRREHVAELSEFAIADGVLLLGSERHELTSVRGLEVLKMRGAGFASGRHFFDIDARGVSIYPRVSVPADTQTQPSAETDRRMATGVAGLDELLGGGLPSGSATVVQGGTGTGKTLIGLHFLLEGAARGEKGVLFTLEETPDQLRRIARGLGWDLAAAEASGHLEIRYASPVELSTDRFLDEARTCVRELGASRAVFDSLTTMALGVPSQRRFKEMVYAIAKHMRGEEVTLLLTVESEQLLGGGAQLSGHGVSFIADNLIQLRYVELDGKLERAISVLKARGIKHDSELRSAAIGRGGMTVVGGRFNDMRGVLTGLPTRAQGDPR